MKLARTLRVDESDTQVFERAAESGEWAISGTFEFVHCAETELLGKRRQAFANGWLSLESFARATLVSVVPLLQPEYDRLAMRLASHLVQSYGAPDLDAALPAAREELDYMLELCDEHTTNTLLVVTRSMQENGVHEVYRAVPSTNATLDILTGGHGAIAMDELSRDGTADQSSSAPSSFTLPDK